MNILQRKNKLLEAYVVNWGSDVWIKAILCFISIALYMITSWRDWRAKLYLASLLFYIIVIFHVVRIRVFTGLGMYVIYLFCFVQSGVLMQRFYEKTFDSLTVSIITAYNFFAPILIAVLYSAQKKRKQTELKRVYINSDWVTLMFLGALVVICLFFALSGIPLLADDAENYRVAAVAGKGFLVVIAAACFKMSVITTQKSTDRLMRLIIACVMLLGTGFRSSTLEIILIYFMVFIIGKGKKFLGKSIAIFLLVGFIYAYIGVIRSGTAYSLLGLWKPVLWRFYVNSSNFNDIIVKYPVDKFQYGLAFLNDLSVILPGAQTTFMTQLKDIMNMHFSGGSLTPTVFGEGYYNWGIVGAVVWPLCTLIFVIYMDSLFRKKYDGRVYYIVSYALAGPTTTSLVPALINGLIPQLLLYSTLIFLSKQFPIKLCFGTRKLHGMRE